MRRLAYRVETQRLILRCWEPTDARVLRAALDASDAHLRPHIPFMRDEPRTLEQTEAWLRRLRASFDLDQHYRYAVFRDELLVGETMLLDRHGNGEWEIGYWQHVDRVGHGYATEGAAAMTHLGFVWLGADRLDIVCSTANPASSSVARKLGFTHEGTLRRRFRAPDGVSHDSMIFSLFADDYEHSPAAKRPLRAWTCGGEALALKPDSDP